MVAIFAAIAAFIVLRLRSVLGRRTVEVGAEAEPQPRQLSLLAEAS